MSKKLKGFSLAELLISLLVISIVLSAAIPTLTKRTSSEREQIWRWSNFHNSTYFGLGANQSVIVGLDTMPMESNSVAELLAADGEGSDGIESSQINTANAIFAKEGDKLVILKQSPSGTNLNNSHISFYNASSGSAASGVTYGGRIAVDKHNLAFGRGTLLSMHSLASDFQGNNTAVGHYALMSTFEGERNVALGEKALSLNKNGSGNTAVGFLAGNSIGNADTNTSSGNTAIGSYALQKNNTGTANTVVGSESLYTQSSGNNNTTIGFNTLGYFDEGSGNTAIGSNACSNLKKGDYNICIGNSVYSEKTEDNYSLAIGSSDGTGGKNNYPLITGYTQKKDTNDKELIVNSKNVIFKPFYGGEAPTFQFISAAGDINEKEFYDETKALATAEAYFNLRYLKGKDSITMKFSADENKADIGSFNPNSISISGSTIKAELKDLSFNNTVRLDFPDETKEIDASNIIKTSIDGQVGLVSDTHDIVINKMLVVRANTTAKPSDVPVLDITKTSVEIKGNSHKFMVGVVDHNIPEFAIEKDKGIIMKSNDGIFLHDKKEENSDALLSIKNNEVSIPTDGKLIVNSIKEVFPTTNGDVKEAIKQLNDNKEDKANPSDARLKNVSGDSTAGLAEINKLEVKNYTYKKDEKKTPHVGVIAQQLQKIFPNSVFKGEDGYLRITTEEIFYAMVNSIKELCAKLQDLTAKIVGLDKRITELEAQNKLLLEQNKAFEKRLEKLEKQAEK